METLSAKQNSIMERWWKLELLSSSPGRFPPFLRPHWLATPNGYFPFTIGILNVAYYLRKVFEHHFDLASGSQKPDYLQTVE